MLGNEAVDGGLEIDDGVEVASLEAALGELGEEALDRVQPRTRCWCEVEGKARMAVEPCAHALQTLDRLFQSTSAEGGERTQLPAPKGNLDLDRIVVRDPEGKVLILKNVSVKLAPGVIVGVIGPSGAGKSTLARVAAGALAPDLGELRIESASVRDWDPELLAEHFGICRSGSICCRARSARISRAAARAAYPG